MSILGVQGLPRRGGAERQERVTPQERCHELDLLPADAVNDLSVAHNQLGVI